ncbi:MAG: serine hydrolase domain-containing protein [Brevundimonas sp.]
MEFRDPPPAVLRALEALVREDSSGGVALLTWRGGEPLFAASLGDIGFDTPTGVASASKWLAAATVMTLVDDGLLDLDEPIGPRLGFTAEGGGAVTLRQLLSYTSGHPGIAAFSDIRHPPHISLAESARRIFMQPLQGPPGARFAYGSGAYQIAGHLAEEASGRSWRDLFRRRIAAPLDLVQSTWGHPLETQPGRIPSNHPNLQAGLVTTARDYGAFLGMLAAGGRWRGQQVLAASSVAELLRVQTLGVDWPKGEGGIGANAVGYGLGSWSEVCVGDRSLVSMSPGAFGVFPWIDRRTSEHGIFMMRRRYPQVATRIAEARRLISAS